jgi:hypothetical protein
MLTFLTTNGKNDKQHSVRAFSTLMTLPARVLHNKIQAARPTKVWFGSFMMHAAMTCNNASVNTFSLMCGMHPYTDLASKVITTTAEETRESHTCRVTQSSGSFNAR